MKFQGKNKKNLDRKLSFKGKGKSANNSFAKTRRELRKEDRKRKKTEKVKSYLDRLQRFKAKKNKNKNTNIKNQEVNNEVSRIFEKKKPGESDFSLKIDKSRHERTLTDISKDNMKTKRDQKALENKMKEQRKKSLLEANREEDKIISNLEKQLKLNRRKSKTMPASFVSSGLDYILDVCNPDKMENFAETEKYLLDSGSEFEDDLAMVKGKKVIQKKAKLKPGESFDGMDLEENGSDSDVGCNSKYKKKVSNENVDNIEESNGSSDEFSDYCMLGDLQGDSESTEFDSMDESNEKHSNIGFNTKSMKNGSSEDLESDYSEPEEKGFTKKPSKNKKIVQFRDYSDDVESDDEMKGRFVRIRNDNEMETNESLKEFSDDDAFGGEEGESEIVDAKNETWEDIYGRMRDKQGNVIEGEKGKYIPPALRSKAQGEDTIKREALERLNRQLKGLLNRLAESNMHSIASQIEDLYMKNSRNDMNQCLINLYTEAIVSPVQTPERLVMEHAMLSAILHANIGTEVGAYILQTFVMNFKKLLDDQTEVGDKRLDNLLAFICHLYTFKVFDYSLLYDILNILCDKFQEKEIELILVILRNSGFNLRKDDPMALKELVLRIQRLASQAVQLKNDSRVNFMLDVLLKIKNNNMSKLPQYDPSHSEHLKKIIKTMIRKGNYVTELKISLEDLLNADERGRWWIVGSAWTGSSGTEPNSVQDGDTIQSLTPSMSEQLSQLAKKLRINTDVRKNIFCVLMTAEDFEDAFEKLHKLGLKGQTMNEIIHVLLHCLLHEKDYNHYYSLIVNRFCQTDRKHRMVIQYSVWDKFKEVENMKLYQITNLAKFLAFIFIEGTMPLSILKVIQLVEMSKSNVRLIRQILLSILYHKDETILASVFLRVTKSPKLHIFREGLRLFLHHFLLKNISDTDKDYVFLKDRITMADRALQSQTF